MEHPSLTRLEHLCKVIPSKLNALSDAEINRKPAAEKWSIKETLGHLIDSATNNHHRFVRAQFEDKPLITYDADQWVTASQYQNMPTRHLLYFWQLYNLHLIEIIRQLPPDLLKKECHSGDAAPHTLAWLFDDYVMHLEHHLRAMVEYD